MKDAWHQPYHGRQGTSGGQQQAYSRVRLYRTSGGQARLLGVCGGIANYFGISAFWIRLATLISGVFFTVPTISGYLLLTLVLDREPEDLYDSPEQEQFWQSVHRAPAQTLSSLDKKFRSMEQRLRRIEAQVTSPGYRMDRDLRDSGPGV
ncbi:PspC domain-containing protein [Pelagibius sp. Alg239-R121]|uniref:PspC domain-containing protein n=1 Tax=Pelagibius sp. Alg239-R121 TaxID=2993448 RepID=UPI0024A77934|nr:PspC domain-containing protein [Pelagibius sp. Alg239-R121]